MAENSDVNVSMSTTWTSHNATLSAPFPPNCLLLPPHTVLPWDNPKNIVSAQAEHLVRQWKDAIFIPILFLIGAPANVINMAVFYKQGLKERINVCLFALSLADFLLLLQTFILRSENMNTSRKERYGPIVTFLTNHNMLGLFGFAWVSNVISAIIASERCFCVLRPLLSRTLLRTSTITVIIVLVNVVTVGLYFFVAFRYRIQCVFDPVRQVSFLSGVAGKFYVRHQKLLDYLDIFVYGVGLPGLVMVVSITTTIITTVKLHQAAAWRAETSSASTNGMTSREIALTKMLVGNSVLFIACVFPVGLFRFVSLLVPAMNVAGDQRNLYLVGIWLLDIFSCCNSTFNIIIYYTMGSRYRQTFWDLLGRGSKEERAVVVAADPGP